MLSQSTHNLLTLPATRSITTRTWAPWRPWRPTTAGSCWVSLYPRDRRGDLLQLAPHWQRDLNPCLFDRGTLLVAPADSPRIFALDAATGQILWQSGTRGGRRRPPAGRGRRRS